MRGLIRSQGDDFESAGIGQLLDRLNRGFDAFISNADVGADNRTVLPLTHLANALNQVIRPFKLLRLMGWRHPMSEALQLLHRHEIVHYEFEEALKVLLVFVLFSHLIQVKVPLVLADEAVRFQR